MKKKWILPEKSDPEKVSLLSQSLNINKTLASVLLKRGINNYEDAKAFFRPSLNDLHDPYEMKDMDRAVERIQKAVLNKEKILVYGDYDVDGTTAVSLFYGFLSKNHSNIDYYIPDRYKEGYGISEEGLRWAEQNGFSLIVTLDCGIRAINLVNNSVKRGIDFIICDHHNPGEELPNAFAVLDPKRIDCSYPYKELTGCGIGFKLLHALCKKFNLNERSLFSYLDMVAVSIAADIVPITGENRILAYYGLKILNHKPRPGFKSLMNISGYKDQIDISGIVFGLAPRINASGRIDHAKDAVKLLLADNMKVADHFADKLNIKNSKRREFDVNITEEALSMIENDSFLKSSNSTVLFKPDWHKGVIGIVASRCIEKFYRPTIILTESENKATGSARSVYGFDVHEAISECSDLLERFGGHTYAAGLTLELDKVDEFRKRFEKVVSDKITEELLVPRVIIDAKIDLKDIHYKFFKIIKQMDPFGPGNMQPVFMTEHLTAAPNGKLMKGEHIKMFVKQKGSKFKMEALGFGLGEHFNRLMKGDTFKLAYILQESSYFGEKYIQLKIRDIKFEDEN